MTKGRRRKKKDDHPDALPAEAPPILRHIKWFYKHGAKHWKVIIVAIVIIGSGVFVSSYLSRIGERRSRLGDVSSEFSNDTMPPRSELTRLTRNYRIQVQDSYNSFLKNYRQVEEEFVSGRSPRSPLDPTVFSEASLEIKKLALEFETKIGTILWKEFGTDDFKAVEGLSKEYGEYQSALEQGDSLIKQISDFQHDPSRITHVFDKLRLRK